ncbi:MAG: MBL fold metallo-hydrolase [Elusimicrobiota bacterium]
MNKIAVLLLLSFVVPRADAHEVRADGKVVFNLQQLAAGVYAAVSPGPQMPAISNTAFAVLDDGVLVVDTHRSPAAAKTLLDEIRKVTDKPVRYLVITHFHGDHMGGISAFPKDIEIIAHDRTRERLVRTGPDGAPLPDLTVSESMTLRRGREVQIRYAGRGHTDGDLFVWLPKESVLIAGDLLFNNYIGFMQDAYVADWAQTLGRLIDLRPTVVVPGHGEVTDVRSLKLFRAYLWDFINAVKEKKKDGLSAAQTAHHFKLPPSYQSWGMQDAALKANVIRVYNELDGDAR